MTMDDLESYSSNRRIVTFPKETDLTEACFRNESDRDNHLRQCKAISSELKEKDFNEAKSKNYDCVQEELYYEKKCLSKGNHEDDFSKQQPICRLHELDKDDWTTNVQRNPGQQGGRISETQRQTSKSDSCSLDKESHQIHLHENDTEYKPTKAHITSKDSKKHRHARKISIRTYRTRQMIRKKVSLNHSFKCSEYFKKMKKVLFPLDFMFHFFSFSRWVFPLDRSYQNPMMRLYSFRFWPLSSHVPTTRLADHGFACTDPELQTVECVSCGYVVNVTDVEDQDVLRDHQNHSPECSFSNQNLNQQSSQLSNQQSNRPLDQQSDQQPQEDGASVAQENGSFNSHRPSDMPFQHLSRTDGFAASGLQTSITLSSISSTNNHVGSETGVQGFQAVPRSNAPDSSESANGQRMNGQSPLPSVRQSVPESITAAPTYAVRNPQYTSHEARRSTFLYWPHQGEHDIDLIVEAGFFFTGSEDVVRCYHCDIGLAEWNRDDDPWLEHARHSPECPYLRQKKGQSYIAGVQREWSQVYQPKHPEYSQMEERMRSFIGSNWPRDQVQQTPEQLAAAGFYFTGDDDTCRCHYCDGGLREWEPNDDPWVEHARWFPFCKYVLKVKGAQFIQRCATGNPSETNNNTRAPPVNVPANFSSQPMTISYVDECRRREQRNPMLSAAALSARSMGYSRRTVYLAINTYIQNTGRRDFKARDLLDIIFEREENGEILEDDEDFGRHVPDNAPASYAVFDGGNDSDEEMELTPEALKKEYEHLLKKLKCIECKEKDRCMVYVPCGHRLVCESCGEKTKNCNHCGVRIDRRVKTFLS